MRLKLLVIFLLCRDNLFVSLVLMPMKRLNDDYEIPMLAFGTDSSEKNSLRNNVLLAIQLGYKHIDITKYANEVSVGQGIQDAIQQGVVRRDELFITTKLSYENTHRDEVIPALRMSLARLGLHYVDLYIIYSHRYVPDSEHYQEGWRGMEKAKHLGLAKSIGVANLAMAEISSILASSNVSPAVNQIEIHPAYTREDLVRHCQKLNIAVMAYNPLGALADNKTVDDPVLKKIAQKYGKSPKQIVLRYLVERGIIPVTKHININDIHRHIDIFNFKLSPQEIGTINQYNKNMSLYKWN